MDKFKWQYIVLFLAVVIGSIIGGTVISMIKEKEISKLKAEHNIQLQKEIKKAEQRVELRHDSIAKLEVKQRELDLKVQQEYFDILKDSIATQKKRLDVKQLTSEQKTNWILNRYSTSDK